MSTKHETFIDLISQASAMLQDISEDAKELIYWAISLDDDLRAAIKFAYMSLKDEGKREEKEED